MEMKLCKLKQLVISLMLTVASIAVYATSEAIDLRFQDSSVYDLEIQPQEKLRIASEDDIKLYPASMCKLHGSYDGEEVTLGGSPSLYQCVDLNVNAKCPIIIENIPTPGGITVYVDINYFGPGSSNELPKCKLVAREWGSNKTEFVEKKMPPVNNVVNVLNTRPSFSLSLNPTFDIAVYALTCDIPELFEFTGYGVVEHY